MLQYIAMAREENDLSGQVRSGQVRSGQVRYKPLVVLDRDIMVWAGTHGSPPKGEDGIGVPLVKSLQIQPIRTENGRVEGDLSNPEAVRRGVRFVEANLSLCFGNPEEFKDTYEGSLVPGILRRSKNRDLVLDMHQQCQISDTDYVYVGSRVSPHVLGLAAAVGIKTVMVTDNGIQGYIPQAVIVDLSQNSERDDLDFWRSVLSTTLSEGLPSPSVEEFTIYAHGELTDSDHIRLGVKDRKFTPLVDEVPGASELLGVDRPVYALYEPGHEVVSRLNTDDLMGINSDDGTFQLPTLKILSGSEPH